VRSVPKQLQELRKQNPNLMQQISAHQQESCRQ
jgi:hypothetical protein